MTVQKKTYLNPEIAFSKLDLPAPLGPIIADSWPFLNTPLTPCSKHFFFESVTVIKCKTNEGFFIVIIYGIVHILFIGN